MTLVYCDRIVFKFFENTPKIILGLRYRGYCGGSSTAVQAWKPCPLWDSHRGRRPLVTPVLVQTRDLLCLVCVSLFYIFVCFCVFCCLLFWVFLCSIFLQYFDTVGWVFFSPVKTVLYNLYCVGRNVKPYSIKSIQFTLCYRVATKHSSDPRGSSRNSTSNVALLLIDSFW